MAAKTLLRVVAALVFLGLLGYLLTTRAGASPTRRKYPDRIPVTFWHMWSAEWKDVVDKIVDRYNRSQTKYEVIALSVPGGSADTKFLLGAVGGNPPDVMAQWNAVIPTWANNDLLVPYDELMTPGEMATFERDAYPVVKRLGLYKGRIYGITIGMNVSGIYYLPEHFRQAGLDPDKFPKTLEELTAAGDRMVRKDPNGHIRRIGFQPAGITSLAPLFRGGFYDWKHDRLTLNTPENLRALTYLVDYYRKYGYDEIVRFQSGLNTASFAGGWPFIGGFYSATFDGAWRVEQLRKYAPNLEYRTARLPAPKGGIPGAGFSNGNFMVIPRAAREKRGAWDFVKFWSGLTDPDVAAEFYTWGGWLPLSDRIANASIYREYVKKYPQFGTFVRAIRSPDLHVLPPVAYQQFVADQIGRVTDLAVRGTLTPKQALEELEQKVDQERKRRKELGYDE